REHVRAALDEVGGSEAAWAGARIGAARRSSGVAAESARPHHLHQIGFGEQLELANHQIRDHRSSRRPGIPEFDTSSAKTAIFDPPAQADYNRINTLPVG